MHIKTLLTVAALAWSTLCVAQDYPQRPITMIVPLSAGGGTDTLARAFAEEMGKRMGQPFVVDNKPGASGTLGARAVASAKPDGYTVLLTATTPIYYAPHLYSSVPYEVKRDFAFITQLASVDMVLVVGKDVPAKNMKEFIAWAEKNRGLVSYGSNGAGGGPHLMSAYLSKSRNLDMNHVPYKGEQPMILDIIGGRLPWGMGSMGSMLPHIQSGKLRALAVLGKRRLQEIPDVPTIVEAGLSDPELQTYGSFLFMAPAGTPEPVLARLEKEARAAIQTTAMKARFQVLGMEARGNSSAEFRRDFENSGPIIRKLVESSGAKLD